MEGRSFTRQSPHLRAPLNHIFWRRHVPGHKYAPEHLQRILDAHSTTITDSNPTEGANS